MRLPRKLTICHTRIFHKMWRGHDLGPVLADDVDKLDYLHKLGDKLTDELGEHIQWHSYCLMNTHPHETGRVMGDTKSMIEQSIDALGDWMRNAHSCFAQQYNRRHNRRGKVACERPKTKEVDDEEGLLTVMFYGDANPVRAGMVCHPKSYRWSSYQFYAYGKRDEVTAHLTPPPAYLALGRTPAERQRKYRQRCDAYLRSKGLLDDAPEVGVDGLGPAAPDTSELDSTQQLGQPAEAGAG
jgi:putative transposase